MPLPLDLGRHREPSVGLGHSRLLLQQPRDMGAFDNAPPNIKEMLQRLSLQETEEGELCATAAASRRTARHKRCSPCHGSAVLHPQIQPWWHGTYTTDASLENHCQGLFTLLLQGACAGCACSLPNTTFSSSRPPSVAPPGWVRERVCGREHDPKTADGGSGQRNAGSQRRRQRCPAGAPLTDSGPTHPPAGVPDCAEPAVRRRHGV